MFKRQLVLAAIDRDSDVERTLTVALSAARARAADLHVIHVVPRRAARVDATVDRATVAPGGDRQRVVEARVAATLRSTGQDGVRVRSVSLRGEPEHAIPAYAQLQQAAMLVIARDYGSSRFWRNSRIVDQLARQSPIPVLVLPKRPRREREGTGLRRILAPVDFSIASAVALRTAVVLARHHGARVTVLHALSDVPHRLVFSGGEAWEVARQLPARAEAVADRLRRSAVFFEAGDVDTQVATGIPAGAIVELATRTDADLVVMGIARRSWIDRLLIGSTLRGVLRRATVPVLVVPVVAGARTWPDELVDQIGSDVGAESAIGRAAA